MPMALLILGAMLLPIALVYVGILSWTAGLIAAVVVLIAAAWNFDRGRRLGAPDPVRDSHRPDFPVPMDGDRQIPTEAVQSPSDRSGKS